MAYEVFESLEGDGSPLRVEEVAASGLPGETRIVGSFADWEAALRTVARLEAEARRKLRGAGGFALGIRPPALPRADSVVAISAGASEANGCT